MSMTPENVPQIKTTESVTPQLPKEEPGAERPFSSFMEGGTGEANPLLASGKTPQISPFDLAQGRVPAPGPNINTLQQQAKMAHSTMGDIMNQLQTPKLKLKQSTKYLLKNKLNGAKGQIKSAANKIGAEDLPDTEIPAGSGPIFRFVSAITDGQNQMNAVQHQLSEIASSGKELRPAEMLLVQVKLNKAQQQLEYTSVLLSKAVDDLKMMMNIQL